MAVTLIDLDVSPKEFILRSHHTHLEQVVTKKIPFEAHRSIPNFLCSVDLLTVIECYDGVFVIYKEREAKDDNRLPE